MSAVLKPKTNSETNHEILTALMVDEFTELHSQVKVFEATQARYDQLKKQLADVASQHSHDQEARLAGNLGYVVFSKPPQTRTITDIAKFFEAVGRDRFIQAVTVSTTKADKLLTATQKAELFEMGKGTRRLKDAGRISSVLFNSLSTSLYSVK
jgi:hypothetical protein